MIARVIAVISYHFRYAHPIVFWAKEVLKKRLRRVERATQNGRICSKSRYFFSFPASALASSSPTPLFHQTTHVGVTSQSARAAQHFIVAVFAASTTLQ